MSVCVCARARVRLWVGGCVRVCVCVRACVCVCIRVYVRAHAPVEVCMRVRPFFLTYFAYSFMRSRTEYYSQSHNNREEKEKTPRIKTTPRREVWNVKTPLPPPPHPSPLKLDPD